MLEKLKTSKELWIILSFFIIGFFIRLYHLGAPSLGDDELTTAVRIDHSFLDTIWLLRHSSFPPVHYAVLNLWTSLVGHSEWALRFPAVLFSSLTVIVIYKLGKELFNKNVGFISASLLAVSPFALHYAQFAKMYALFWFLASSSLLFLFRFLKKQKKNSRLLYILTSTLCCYTMYAGFLLVAAQSVIILLIGQRTRWREYFTAQLVIISLCLPWIVWFLNSTHETFGLARPTVAFDYLGFFMSSFQLITGSGLEIWTRESWAEYSFKSFLWKINCFSYAFLMILSLSQVLTKITNKGKSFVADQCLWIWVAIPLIVYTIFDHTFVPIELEVRYIGFLQVPIILIAASQIDQLQKRIKIIILGVLIIISITGLYFSFRDSVRFPQQDWRTTVRELTQEIKKDDVVVSFLDLEELKYYFKGDTSRFYAIPEKDSPVEFLMKKSILSPQVNSVFIIYKNGQPPDIQLNGFSLVHKVFNESNGFLHFRRT